MNPKSHHCIFCSKYDNATGPAWFRTRHFHVFAHLRQPQACICQSECLTQKEPEQYFAACHDALKAKCHFGPNTCLLLLINRYTMAAQDLIMRARGVLRDRGWRISNDKLGSGDDISVYIIPLMYGNRQP